MNILEKILEEIDTEVQKQRELCKDLEDTPGYKLYEKVAAVFKGIITKHMDDVNNDGWIPVSERLPGSSDNGESLDITKELAVYSRNVLMQYCNSQRDCSKCCFELNGGCSLISGPPCIWAKKGVSENGIQKS